MTKITLLSNLFQILQTRFELVRLAPTDFKSVVYTVPPPEDNLLYPDYFDMFEINENYSDHFIYGVILLSPQVYHDK